MNISLERHPETLTGEIIVHIAPEDYRDAVNLKLKEQARKATLPGFRPGKVPVGVIRRMVGRGLVIDELNDMLGKKLDAYLKEEDFSLLGQPLPIDKMSDEDFDPNCEKEMIFRFEIGFAPKVDLDLMLDEKPFLYEISVAEERIEEEIAELRDRFAQQEQVDECAPGDVVMGKLMKVDDAGEPLADGPTTLMPLNPARIDKPEIFARLEGKKIGERIPFALEEVSGEDAVIKELFFIEEEVSAQFWGQNTAFELVRITRTHTAELDETFFGKVAESKGWEQVPENIENLRDQLREAMEEEASERPKWFFFSQVRKQLIKQHPLPFPEAFLKKWLQERNEKQSIEEIEAEFPHYLESLTWSLIQDQLTEENPSLIVSSEDLKEGIMESLQGTMGAMDPVRQQEIFNYFLQNEELLQMHYQRMRNSRLIDFCLETFKPETRLISLADFEELQKAEEADPHAEVEAAKHDAEEAEVVTEEKPEDV